MTSGARLEEQPPVYGRTVALCELYEAAAPNTSFLPELWHSGSGDDRGAGCLAHQRWAVAAGRQ
jgi:hypothetical protein